MSDWRIALRQLGKHRGFTFVAVLTLALGIGANTAIFSVLNGVLFRPLPYPDPERLVTLWERRREAGIDQERVSGPNYLDWRAQNTVFVDMAASPGWTGSGEVNLVLRDRTVRVDSSFASSSLFSTLGTPPLLGRGLSPAEDQQNGSQAVVLGYSLWQRHFGGDSSVIGRSLTVDSYGRRDYTIVGVMPPGFGLPSRVELWLPLGSTVSLESRRSARWHNVIARLRPGVSLARAQAEMNTIQARLKQAYPEALIGSEVAIVPLLEQALGPHMKRALYVLWAVVGGVLLIAAANVANLLLARAAARRKEFAVRVALGASGWRLTRQLLVESVLLASLGGLAGLALSWWSLQLIKASGLNIPRLEQVSLDARVFVFTAAVAVLTGLLFGLAPAWQCLRPRLNQVLKESTYGTSAGTAASRTRQVLVMGEVALSLVLLVAAGLMLQSFGRMLKADRGFQTEHLLTAKLDFSVSGFTTWVQPTATRPQVSLQQLIDRLRAYPGVQAIGASSGFFRRENTPPGQPFSIFGRGAINPGQQPTAEFKGITPGWVQSIGAQILRGRDFTETDSLHAPGVALINQTFARRFFPNQDPIGQHVALDNSGLPLDARDVHGVPVWSQIVGVINDVRSIHPQPEAVPDVYRPAWQWPMQSPTLFVRTRGDPDALTAAIIRETKTLIPNLPTPLVRPMDEVLAESVAQPRVQAALLSSFGLLALLLASVGLYGVLAWTVVQRTREIAIRMALGAGRWQVLSLVVGQGMRLAIIGVGAGLLLAWACTRVLRSLLYEVKPAEPVTFAAVAGVLLLVALFASWLPARRAARVDPNEALRAE